MIADKVLEFQHWNGAVIAFMKCPRCDGRGYHHGFGEHGTDPDWCNRCGGGQTVCADLLTPLDT